jgi:hypothetical protein
MLSSNSWIMPRGQRTSSEMIVTETSVVTVTGGALALETEIETVGETENEVAAAATTVKCAGLRRSVSEKSSVDERRRRSADARLRKPRAATEQ